jgi:alpha-tubulin suppressor-like RCC1 family protein
LPVCCGGRVATVEAPATGGSGFLDAGPRGGSAGLDGSNSGAAGDATGGVSDAGARPLRARMLWRGSGQHSCAVTEGDEGAVYCWALALPGVQAPDGNPIWSMPARVPGLASITQIATGSAHTCVLDAAGVVRCWGANRNGQLGDDTVEGRHVPLEVKLPPARWVAAGYVHSCAVARDGAVWCWGYNNRGQLGVVPWVPRSLLPRRVALAEQALTVETGSFHSCATTSSGAIWCWGANYRGQLGDLTNVDRREPVLVAWKTPAARIALGSEHTCATSLDDRLWCWGQGDSGQLATGGLASSLVPVLVAPPVSPVRAFACGPFHNCAAPAESGKLVCWGANGSAMAVGAPKELGAVRFPVEVQGLGPVVAVAAGVTHTCAIEARTSHVYCWGCNGHGELGVPNTLLVSRFPIQVMVTD